MPKSASRRKRPSVEQEQRLNERVARRLAQEMAETHAGQWVGLVGGEVAAVAATLDEVVEAMRRIEPNPRRGLVFRAGEDYRKKLIILAVGRR
jgi:hypothetical protein